MQQHIINYQAALKKRATTEQKTAMKLEREFPVRYAVNAKGQPSTKSFRSKLGSYIGDYQASEVEKLLRAKLPVDLFYQVTTLYADAIGQDLQQMSSDLYPKFIADLTKVVNHSAQLALQQAYQQNVQNQQLIGAASGSSVSNAASSVSQSISRASSAMSPALDYGDLDGDEEDIREDYNPSPVDWGVYFVPPRSSSVVSEAAVSDVAVGSGMIRKSTMRAAQIKAGNDSKRYRR